MSHFSKEYVQHQGINVDFQFSYQEVFENLGLKQSHYEVCDGFGTIGIKNIKGQAFLVKSNGQEINFQKLLTEKKD